MVAIRATSVISNYNIAIARADSNAKKAIRNYLRREVDHWQTKLERLTSSWNHHVEFKVGTKLQLKNDVMGISITTDDAIFGFLDEGTSIRTRKMNPDYSPKTEIQSFLPHGHGGRVVAIADMPGIDSRGWFDLIERDFERTAFDTVTEILQDFSKEANDW